MSRPHEPPATPPLPKEWLPEPLPPEGAPEWDVRARRIVAAAADPGASTVPTGPRAGRWSVMAGWWRPAAALAAAAAALVLLSDASDDSIPSAGSIPLGLLAAEGDAAALWTAAGVEADPVLALIALRERTAPAPEGRR